MKIGADFKERKLFLGAMISFGLVPFVFLIHSIFDKVFVSYTFGPTFDYSRGFYYEYVYEALRSGSDYATTLSVFCWLCDLLMVACMGFLIFALLTDRIKLFIPAGFAGLAVVQLLKTNVQFFFSTYGMTDLNSDYFLASLLHLLQTLTALLCFVVIALFFVLMLIKLPILQKLKPLTEKLWFAPIILAALPVLFGILCFWINFFVYGARVFDYLDTFEALLKTIWWAIKDLFSYASLSQILVTAAVAFICLQLNKLYGTPKPKKAKAPKKPAPAPAQPAWENGPQYAPEQPTWNAPEQPTWNAPEQPAWNAPKQPTWNAPEQPTWNTPEQPAWNAPQSSSPFNATEPPAWDIPQSTPDNDPFEALRQYQAQLDAGMITQAEYEAKRREVLGL